MSDGWTLVERQIGAATGLPFVAARRLPLSGGCIHSAWRLTDGQRNYFVKTHAAEHAAMFEEEAEGLRELAASQTVRVPEPIGRGSGAGQAWLILEYLPLGGGEPQAMATLGRQLAALHARPQPYFGWHRDNHIGSSVQPNGRHCDWIAFWRDRRLGFQLALAARNGHRGALQRQGERLQSRLAELFEGYRPVPALVHGDLWAGNAGVAEGSPVIFDPAVYYGDREADLAMTELFGGFPTAFYTAYREAFPLTPGYAQRKVLYNLYHILNHLNLFGGGYRGQAERMMAQLLAELG